MKQLYLVTMHLLTPPLNLKELAKRSGAAGRFCSPGHGWRRASRFSGSVAPFAAFNDRERRVKVSTAGSDGGTRCH